LPDPVETHPLDPLEARLKAAKARHEPEPKQIVLSAFARGTRHAMEIAATTIVGAGVGWVLDRWLGTKPGLFLLFLLLGIAAGFWNLVKAVNAEAATIRKDAAAKAATREGGGADGGA
jgi:ATP synthase protein I